jgi:hypothetical protein
MSLDVYLKEPRTIVCDCGKEHTVATETIYDANITHNLNKMAMAISDDFYNALWRPDECGIATAGQLLPIINTGLAELKSDRNRLVKFQSPNGYGTYEGFVNWLERYRLACENHPDALIEVSR